MPIVANSFAVNGQKVQTMQFQATWTIEPCMSSISGPLQTPFALVLLQ